MELQAKRDLIKSKADNSVMGLYPWKWEDNVNLDIMFKSLGNNTIRLAVLWPKSKLYYSINVGWLCNSTPFTTKKINEQNTHWGNELKLKFVFVKKTK